MAILKQSKTKHQVATDKATAAVGLFDTAKTSLAEANELLVEHEEESRALAEYHTAQADQAQADRERYERVQGRIEDLLA